MISRGRTANQALCCNWKGRGSAPDRSCGSPRTYVHRHPAAGAQSHQSARVSATTIGAQHGRTAAAAVGIRVRALPQSKGHQWPARWHGYRANRLGKWPAVVRRPRPPTRPRGSDMRGLVTAGGLFAETLPLNSGWRGPLGSRQRRSDRSWRRASAALGGSSSSAWSSSSRMVRLREAMGLR